MISFDPIEKIATPSPAAFRERYVAARRPVVLTDLLAGDPLSQIRTEAAARERLGGIPLRVREEYSSFFIEVLRRGDLAAIARVMEHPGVPEHVMLEHERRELAEQLASGAAPSLASYLDFVRAEPRTTRMCAEQPAPPAVTELFRIPDVCGGAEDTRTLIFVGNAGNFAHLHFDADLRHVLLYQVFGKKRVVLIPTAATRKVQPYAMFSTMYLEHFTPEDRAAFLRYTGGIEFDLLPGEALYIPALTWHYVDYTDTGMSVSIRFGRNEHTRFLCDEYPPDHHFQAVASKLLLAEVVERDHADTMRRLREAAAAPYPTRLARHRALKAVLAELAPAVCPEIPDAMYAPSLEDVVELLRPG